MRPLFPRVASSVNRVPAVASAQYFGQNRVMYTKFDFEVIHTEHFDIYFYPVERAAAFDAFARDVDSPDDVLWLLGQRVACATLAIVTMVS